MYNIYFSNPRGTSTFWLFVPKNIFRLFVERTPRAAHVTAERWRQREAEKMAIGANNWKEFCEHLDDIINDVFISRGLMFESKCIRLMKKQNVKHVTKLTACSMIS